MKDDVITSEYDSFLRELDELDDPGQEHCPAKEATNKDEVIAMLASLGATSLRVEYDGSGDSGAIEEIICDGPDDAIIELPANVREAVEDYVYDTLPDGWEIDAGGYDSAQFDIAAGTVRYFHAQRVIFDTEWEV